MVVPVIMAGAIGGAICVWWLIHRRGWIDAGQFWSGVEGNLMMLIGLLGGFIIAVTLAYLGG